MASPHAGTGGQILSLQGSHWPSFSFPGVQTTQSVLEVIRSDGEHPVIKLETGSAVSGLPYRMKREFQKQNSSSGLFLKQSQNE